MFTVAGAKVILDFYGNDEVAQKHSRVQELLKEVRRKFNVAAAEVEDFHDPERGVLGLSLCAANEHEARTKMAAVLGFIDASSFARVVAEDSEYFGME